jgi:hypothetical protein
VSDPAKPIRPDLSPFAGDWRGTWKTWIEPDVLHDESPIEAVVTPLIEGRDITVVYTASIGADAVEGFVLAGPLQHGGVHVAWVDSWHTSGLVQAGDGHVTPDGFAASVAYSYDGQAWTWSSEYSVDSNRLVIRHYNEGPGCPRYLGVEAVLERITAS